MRFPCGVLPVLFTFGAAVAGVQASDYAARYLTPEFAYDAARSKAAEKSAELLFEMLGVSATQRESRVWVYGHPGSIEQAFAAIRIPDTAKVRKPYRTDHAMGLALAAKSFPEQARAAFGPSWPARAEARAAELGSVEAMQFVIHPDGDLEALSEAATPGEPLRLVQIEGVSPMLELATLEVVPGTWVRIIETTFTAPSTAAVAAGAAEDAGPGAADLGISSPAGAIWIDPDDVPPLDELQGDHNYLVKSPMRPVVDAYVKSAERHCQVVGDGVMAGPDDTEIPMIDIQCLTHPGEVRQGDDVVALTITVPSEELLNLAAPSTQGNWTLVMFSRWEEEE